MSKKKQRIAGGSIPQIKRPMLVLFVCSVVVVLIVAVGMFIRLSSRIVPSSNVEVYQQKLALLEADILTETTETAIGTSPAGGQAGYAVFISICNTAERASVFCGTGVDLHSAWTAADYQTTEFLTSSNYDPVWVKVDVVSESNMLVEEELSSALERVHNESYRYGIAFDPMFGTALLETELNGAKIYDYDNERINYDYLNRYLSKAGRSKLDVLPDAYLTFRCLSWFCDEANNVHELIQKGPSSGRRESPLIDDAYAMQLMSGAGSYLAKQLNPDGSFIYGIYPRFDNEMSGYNIVRHAGTIWSLAIMYRLSGDPELPPLIDSAIEYLMENLIYSDEHTAYILKEDGTQTNIGTSGLTIIALTEYMDAVSDDRYLNICLDLGNGIIALQDQETGEYYQVLNSDLTPKKQFATVFYDGEATFGLCRLYGMIGDSVWLDAAKRAVDHFIDADYTQYMDHWVAYSMNEITKYVDDPRYYSFGLRNAQVNLGQISKATTTYPTHLELLMSTFELYDRAVENGIGTEDFDLRAFLDTISIRVNRQLDGYFYPEYAMYMRNPQRILNAFMVRHDGYRVRIDDVQHNIGGYYLYFKNYDKLLAYGMAGGKPAE